MRLSPLLLLPLALITLIAAAGQPLTLLHFNDFHGQLEPYADQESGKVLGESPASRAWLKRFAPRTQSGRC
jgi:2',3'-cyclic-nucleotide 2'-phosphodiesterase (5'-nucleotidase family)